MVEITHTGTIISQAERDYHEWAREVAIETGVELSAMQGPSKHPVILAARRVLVELLRRNATGELAKLATQGMLLRGGVLRETPCDKPGAKASDGRWNRCRHTTILDLRKQYNRDRYKTEPRLQDRSLIELVAAIEARMGLYDDRSTHAPQTRRDKR